MRWLKVTGWIALAIGLLAVAAALALTQFVDPNSFRDDIERAVRNATGRELRIRGDLGLTWYPWLAVTLRDSELAGPAGMPAPVSWREARIGAKLWPLLRGRLEIDRVSLDGLKLQLERNRDGVANWTAPPQPIAAATRQERPLRIAGLDISDAQIEFVDRAKEARWQFCALDLKTDEISLDAQVSAQGSVLWMRSPVADCAQSKSNKIAVPVEFGGAYVPAARGFELRDLTLRHAATGYQLRAPVVSADLAAQSYRAAQWVLAGKDLAVAGGPLMLVFKDAAALSTELDITKSSPRALATAIGLKLPGATDPTALASLQGKLALKSDAQGWELRSEQLKLDATNLTGWIRANAGANGPIEFEWQADALRLDGYLPPSDPAAAPFQFPRDALRELQARGRLAVRKLQWLDVTAHDALLVLELRDGELRAVDARP